MSNKPRVLLAEDHAVMRQAFLSLLAEAVEIVGIVERGDQVVEAAIRLQPDLVLLDVSLPGQSGLRILPALRASLPQAAIIVLTVNTQRLYREEALERGADLFLDKGQAALELLPAIRATFALGQRRQYA